MQVFAVCKATLQPIICSLPLLVTCNRQLQFLVVDEADRLLRQDYQGWLPHVLAALHDAPRNTIQEVEPAILLPFTCGNRWVRRCPGICGWGAVIQ